MKNIKERSFCFSFKNNHNNYNIYFFFYIISFFCILNMDNLSPQFNFPGSITLLNGNVLIIHQDGIDIYSSSLENKIDNIYNFSEYEKIDSNKVIKIIISRFSPSNYGYIISIINDQIYIFDYKGNYLYKNETKIDPINDHFYELLPIKYNDSKISYMVGYVDKDDLINLLLYEYNVKDNSSNLLKTIAPFHFLLPEYNGKRTIEEKFLTC